MKKRRGRKTTGKRIGCEAKETLRKGERVGKIPEVLEKRQEHHYSVKNQVEQRR